MDFEVVKIVVEPTVKKSPFGFKVDNSMATESLNYSSSLSRSKSSNDIGSKNC